MTKPQNARPKAVGFTFRYDISHSGEVGALRDYDVNLRGGENEPWQGFLSKDELGLFATGVRKVSIVGSEPYVLIDEQARFYDGRPVLQRQYALEKKVQEIHR